MLANIFFATVTVVSLCAMAAQAGQLQINDCTTDSPSLALEVSLSSPNFTDGEFNPQLRRGQSYTLTISFKSATSTSALTTKVAALIDGQEAPWNAINPSTCNFLISGVCPFVTGQSYTYQNNLEVPTLIFPMRITILWRIRLPDNRNEVCFELPAQITN